MNEKRLWGNLKGLETLKIKEKSHDLIFLKYFKCMLMKIAHVKTCGVQLKSEGNIYC